MMVVVLRLWMLHKGDRIIFAGLGDRLYYLWMLDKGDRIIFAGLGDRLYHAFIIKYNFILVNYYCKIF
ncbi:hypothetical protein JYQ62_37270 [Nostoc sp. UHCC 0702]|nr:hypothetical protein JYQ62_37270 [Nostoc sp. UHCC 0702]